MQVTLIKPKTVEVYRYLQDKYAKRN